MDTTLVRRPTVTDPRIGLRAFCRDPAGLARRSTDFVFDFASADQWGGTVPAAGATLPVAPFANLALDASPMLGRTAAVTLANVGGQTGATADGHGLTIANGENAVWQLAKAGTPTEQVANPKAEGFQNFYLGAWLRLRAPRADQFNAGLFGQGQNANISYGLWLDANGNVQDIVTGRVVRPATVGVLMHVGLALAFDTVADTSTLRLFADGAEVGAASAYTKPSAWAAPAGDFGVGHLGGYGAAQSTIARVERTYTAWPTATGTLDPLALHQESEKLNRARLA